MDGDCVHTYKGTNRLQDDSYFAQSSTIRSLNVSHVVEQYFTFDMTWIPLFFFLPFRTIFLASERDTWSADICSWNPTNLSCNITIISLHLSRAWLRMFYEQTLYLLWPPMETGVLLLLLLLLSTWVICPWRELLVSCLVYDIVWSNIKLV